MTFYVMFTLGKVSSTSEKWYSCDIRNFVAEKKFSLSIFGVVLVLLSVAASIGLFGLCGVPSTIVSFQVLPFLVSIKQVNQCYNGFSDFLFFFCKWHRYPLINKILKF